MLKVKNILLLFLFSTLACSVARIFCFLHVTDIKTGFFIHRLRASGLILVLFVFFILACVFIFPLFLKLKPAEFKKANFLNAVVSLALGLALAFDMLKGFNQKTASLWQFAFKEAFGLLSAAVFFLLGLSAFTKLKFPKASLCVPVFFFVFQTIEIFSAYSTLAVISEHIFDLMLLCFLLVFFLYFGKFCNSLESKSDSLLLSVGLCASVLCISSFISKAVAVAVKGKTAIHSSLPLGVSVLFFGIFIAAWLFCAYFKAESNRDYY